MALSDDERRKYHRNWYDANKDRLRDDKREYSRRYRQRNQEKCRAGNRERYHARVASYAPFIDAAKRAGCSVPGCRERDPRALEFHHVDPRTKLFHVGRCVHEVKWSCGPAVLVAEMAKCCLICANHHAIQHAAERGDGKPTFRPRRLPRAHLPVMRWLRSRGEDGKALLAEVRRTLRDPPGPEVLKASQQKPRKASGRPREE